MRSYRASARIFKYVRVMMKLRQKQLARHLRVTQSSISKIETGRLLPGLNTWERLESLTQMSLRELALRSRSEEY